MAKFRPQRGTLEDSLRDMVDVFTRKALFDHLRATVQVEDVWSARLGDMTVARYVPDWRVGWSENYLVSINGLPMGFVNANLPIFAEDEFDMYTMKSLLSASVERHASETYNIKVLASRLVGSQLWGYATHNSDYDFHLLYVRQLKDYLGFLPRKTIRYGTLASSASTTVMTDVFGYDVVDFIRLMSQNDVGVAQFMYAQSHTEDSDCMRSLSTLFYRTNKPNLLIRKYLGQTKAHLKAADISGGSKPRWTALMALSFAYQLRETEHLFEMNVREASKKFLPSLHVDLTDGEMRFDRAEFDTLLKATDAWNLSYPARTEEDVALFNRVTQDIVRCYAEEV